MGKQLDSLSDDFRPLIVALLAELKLRGIDCVVTSGRRTIKEQDKLYEQGRTTAGEIVTKAKGGQSAHNFGLAADLCPVNPVDGSLWWSAPDDIWHVISCLAEERGFLESGYDWKFKDSPHLEAKDWKKTQALWREGKISVA